MDDTQNTEAEAVSEPTTAPVASKTDVIVDVWFGDYQVPNHFSEAKAELKRRLNEAG